MGADAIAFPNIKYYSCIANALVIFKDDLAALHV